MSSYWPTAGKEGWGSKAWAWFHQASKDRARVLGGMRQLENWAKTAVAFLCSCRCAITPPPKEEPKRWAGNRDGKAGLHGDGHLADSHPPVRVSVLESERRAGSLLLGRPGTFPGTSAWCGPELNAL